MATLVDTLQHEQELEIWTLNHQELFKIDCSCNSLVCNNKITLCRAYLECFKAELVHEADINVLDSPVIGVGDTFVTSLNRIIREANSAASGRRFPNSTPIINDVRGETPRKRSCRRTSRFELSDDEDNEGLPDLSYGLALFSEEIMKIR